MLLLDAGIVSRPTSARNPQSNGIIERVHQVIAQIIRTYLARNPPVREEDAKHIVESAFATAMHATRCAAHSQLDHVSPGSVAFGRDMLLPIPFVVDLLDLQQSRQQKVDTRLIAANRKRTHHDYRIGHMVYHLRDRGVKLSPVWEGPHMIEEVHTNGTVSIRLNDHAADRVNVRSLKPST